ncbi:GNAT family N-acetyltransferase [Alkalihalobacillus sp. LMS6]|uniref:GNAT family N-acetyltransferase n=1 Tax=Bacillaceae TaxID=186817 RepID=UPI000C078A52|nr:MULTISPECIES: GNAT family N-acetyltransferase [Bacillaceae]UTR06355.1 GNAT family N-acetyltransferase [Alkalihalobacillus sp. LMS6]
MTVKSLTTADFDEAFQLSRYAFQAKPTQEQTEFARTQWASVKASQFGIKDNDRIISKLTLLSLHIHLYNTIIPMGGIASVASYPEARRRGSVRKLLLHSLEQMKENGQLISYLAPFSVPFYRKFGWEILCDEVTYTLRKDQLPLPLPNIEGSLSRTSYTDSRIKTVYEQSICHGMLHRDDDWWARKQEGFKENETVLYEDADGTPMGYIVYHIENSKWKTEEFVYVNQAALKALLHFIGQHDSMLQEATLTVPESKGMHFFLPDPLTSAETKPYFMARIVDFSQFIAMLPFKEEGQFTIRIQDECAAWNDQTFSLSIQESHVTCEPTSAPPTIFMTIQVASSLLMGYRRPEFFRDTGLITGERNDVHAFLQTLPTEQPTLHDFF